MLNRLRALSPLRPARPRRAAHAPPQRADAALRRARGRPRRRLRRRSRAATSRRRCSAARSRTEGLVFLLAAQPTRGLDVGAVEAVYGQIRAACERGVGVLLISSELDELLSVADRIVVLYRGRIMGHCAAEPAAARAHRRDDGGARGMSSPGRHRDRCARHASRPAGRSWSRSLAVIAATLLRHGAGRRRSACRCRRRWPPSPTAPGARPMRWRRRSTAPWRSALVGLGFVLAQRANLTNVGGEGQIAVGGIAATAVAPLRRRERRCRCRSRSCVPMLARCVAGGLWGGIAGVLKAKVGTNEVISTLLLSFIARLAALRRGAERGPAAPADDATRPPCPNRWRSPTRPSCRC